MTLSIRLLGRPRIERDGEVAAAPRGRKAWALLAYLLLCRRPPSRARLAELMFAEAADPLRALRWSLAELRRALGAPGACRGDPVELQLGDDVDVDVHRLSSPGSTDEAWLEQLGGDLLEGMTFASSPALEGWLFMERRHLAAATEALLRERTLGALGAGRVEIASRLAARLVELNRFEEGHHELLVRALIAAGDRRAAGEHVDACRELFRRELGTAPSTELLELTRSNAPTTARPAEIGGAAAARGRLESGLAAIAAGAVESGIESLRAACAAAADCRDAALHARALLALGKTLVHAMRGHGEGAEVLQRAVEVAKGAGASEVAATAYRELGFVDVQAGRRQRAENWLARAVEAAQGADEEMAAILGVRGMGLSDAAHYEQALACFEESIECAQRVDRWRQVAWSSALVGRALLLTGRYVEARRALQRSLDLVSSERWIAFLPLPETLIAEVDLEQGRADEAREALEHAFTIACQLADPCWEGISARGLGLLEGATGRADHALKWLQDARVRCTRVRHPYQWVHGWILDAMCGAAVEQGQNQQATGWIDELAALAASTGMRELVVRAYLHRSRLGEPGALEAARLLAADIENPAIEA